MPKVLHKKPQSLWWLVLLFLIVGCHGILAGVYQWGSKPIPLGMSILIGGILVLSTLFFYQLTITIPEEYALAKFGIDLLEHKVLIKDLELPKAKINSLSLLSGVVYRYDSRELFFNTKPGLALFIPGNKDNHFFVGTKHGEKIIKVLKTNIRNAELVSV